MTNRTLQRVDPIAERLEAFIETGTDLVYRLRRGNPTAGRWHEFLNLLAALPLSDDVYRSAETLIRQTSTLPDSDRLGAASDVMRVLRRVGAELRRFPEVRG